MKIIYNYITTNIVNGKQYVGMHSARDVNNTYIGSGFAFKRAVEKYGKDCFKCEILCICESKDQAYRNEKTYIEKYNTLHPNGYNLSPTGGLLVPGCFSDKMKESLIERNKNRIVSAATRKKMSNKYVSEETRKKMSIANTGRKHTEEWIQNSIKRHTGAIRSVETRKKLSEARKGRTPWNKGKVGVQVVTDETRLKMSLARKGEKNPNYGKNLSDEVKDKIRNAHIGMKMPLHVLLAQTGRKMSNETRLKISKSLIGNKRALKRITINNLK